MIQNPFNALLPEVPLDGIDPLLSAYLQDLNDKLNRAFQTFNVPGLITGVTVTATGTRVFIQWNADPASSIYRVYRNSTGDFSTATVVASVGASKTGVAQLSAQDVNDITIPTLYYWVQGVNERGQVGQQSAMATLTNFATSGTVKSLINGAGQGLFLARYGTTAKNSFASCVVTYTIAAVLGTTAQQVTGIVGLNHFIDGSGGSALTVAAEVGSSIVTLATGTLGVAWNTFATFSQGFQLSVTATSSMAAPTMFIRYAVVNNSQWTLEFL